MATPAWPSSLPRPDNDTYTYTPNSGVVETDMDDGTVLVRRRFLTNPVEYDVTWTFSDAQLATFEDWFWDNTNGLMGGALKFTTPLKNGNGINNLLSQFIHGSNSQPYVVAAIKDQPGYSTVTAKLRSMVSLGST